jgi:transposase
VHVVGENGAVHARKTLRRTEVLRFFAQSPPCLIGIEACAGSHYWARELGKLGHTVKLMAAQFVSAYRKGCKNDANDAEAICEAVGRPNMRFVAVKTEEQQAVLTWHRARSLIIANRTAQVNQIRGLLGEFGLIVPLGVDRLRKQLPDLLATADNGLPVLARQLLNDLLEQLRFFDKQLEHYDVQISELARASEPARRLIAGFRVIGPT